MMSADAPNDPFSATTTGPTADDLKTEKEKGGKDPVGKSEKGDKLETMEDLGIDAGTPYPSGSPPAPEVAEKTQAPSEAPTPTAKKK